jgi:hypothetical protein
MGPTPSGRAGRLAHQLMHLDLVILDELGYLPFSQAGGALLFHLLSKLYEHTSVVITTNLVESYRFRHSSQTAKARIKSREQARGKSQEVAPAHELTGRSSIPVGGSAHRRPALVTFHRAEMVSFR